MLWNLNVNVAEYTHPIRLNRLRPVFDTRRAMHPAARSVLLIELHQLSYVASQHLNDSVIRVALLDADDVRQLARLAAGLASREAIRLCVVGDDMRHCVRVLGRSMLDRVLAHEQAIDLTILDRFDRQFDAMQLSLPKRLLKAQRQLIRALCDGLPLGAAQRMRLRFRPGYFDGVAPVDDARSLAQLLLRIRGQADLSERATCILG